MRIKEIFNVPEVKPPKIQLTPATDKSSISVGFLPQWLINQILIKEGVSTKADRINARYTSELKFVALIVIPKYAVIESKISEHY